MIVDLATRTIRAQGDDLTDAERAAIAEIRDLQHRRARALENADGDFHQGLLTEDCTIVHGAGFAESKQDYIPSFIRRLEIRDAGYRDVTYRVLGDTVIENGIFEMTVRQKLEEGGASYRAVALYTIAWHRMADGWKIVLIHQTRVPPKP
ncbi:nuclear transport factor 2 family protein [Sphingobium sp. MK2]|uniref:nuclear transport factor 2 family protein n=1 Tax=Sphingobium sp. MK2 TaxID=3116540 RepID=UPI0032E36651